MLTLRESFAAGNNSTSLANVANSNRRDRSNSSCSVTSTGSRGSKSGSSSAKVVESNTDSYSNTNVGSAKIASINSGNVAKSAAATSTITTTLPQQQPLGKYGIFVTCFLSCKQYYILTIDWCGIDSMLGQLNVSNGGSADGFTR